MLEHTRKKFGILSRWRFFSSLHSILWLEWNTRRTVTMLSGYRPQGLKSSKTTCEYTSPCETKPKCTSLNWKISKLNFPHENISTYFTGGWGPFFSVFILKTRQTHCVEILELKLFWLPLHHSEGQHACKPFLRISESWPSRLQQAENFVF